MENIYLHRLIPESYSMTNSIRVDQEEKKCGGKNIVFH